MVLAMGLAAGMLAGCGTDPIPVGVDTTNPTIQVMTSASKSEPADESSPVVQEIERYLGEAMSKKYDKQYDKVSLDLQWVASTAYAEKVTAAMGANTYPHVMLVNTRNSSVIQNSKAGTFWDITDYFYKTDEKYVSDDNPEGYLYPRLAQANPVINKNISVDGKIYGLYRARTIGRQGVTIRKDWLDNLGLSEPTTIDEFEEVLKQFTEGDPDGNGVKGDTYGMIVTSYLDGPLNNLALWMGSPNEWGYDEETQEWKPWFMSEGYFDAMTKMREWYAAGYINSNMATLDSNSWDNDFLNGIGGVQIDVADRARRNATNILKNDPNAEVDVFGYVKKDKDSEPTILPTTGYNGYYVFPTPTVGDETDLDFILSVMDECNGEYVVDLCNYGILGRNYELDENGKAVKYTEDAAITAEYADLNQFSMGLAPTELTTAYANKTAEKVEQVYEENELYAVMNPMAPYTSDTYAMSGTQLDAIISEAKTNYIVGKISAEDYEKAIKQWIKMDGDLVCKDYQEAFEKDESNIDENGNVVIPDEYKYKFKF
jgi:putative aldouronate transport system substrate-binding protein